MTTLKSLLIPAHRSLIIYSRILVTPTTIYLVGIAKSTQSFTLHATTLSPTDGTLIASQNIISSLTALTPVSPFILLTNSNSTQGPHVLWLDSKAGLSKFNLTPNLKGEAGAWKGVKYSELVDIGLGEEHGLFIVITEDGTSKAARFGDEGLAGIKSIYTFPDSVCRLSPLTISGYSPYSSSYLLPAYLHQFGRADLIRTENRTLHASSGYIPSKWVYILIVTNYYSLLNRKHLSKLLPRISHTAGA